MKAAWTRRTFLRAAATSSILFASRGQDLAGEAKKSVDPATEFEVLRLSGPAYNAWLPFPENRAFTRKGDMLVFAADRGGARQLYRHQFKQNKVKTLTAAAQLNVDSFTLTAGDKTLLYVDGARLMSGSLNGSREREILTAPSGWTAKIRITASDDGAAIFLAGSNGSKTRIVAASGKNGSAVAEVDGEIGWLAVRPKRMAISFLAGGRIRCLSFDGRTETPLKLAAGEIACAQWSSDGSTLLYLVRPRAGQLPEIREANLEEGTDAFVAKTSQFTHFQRNGDASVFLGASASKASPYLMLLLRAPVRELPVCEHKTSDARQTRAIFSPNSSRLAFQTDRDGKMAVYSMTVDKLIEETEEP